MAHRLVSRIAAFMFLTMATACGSSSSTGSVDDAFGGASGSSAPALGGRSGASGSTGGSGDDVAGGSGGESGALTDSGGTATGGDLGSGGTATGGDLGSGGTATGGTDSGGTGSSGTGGDLGSGGAGGVGGGSGSSGTGGVITAGAAGTGGVATGGDGGSFAGAGAGEGGAPGLGGSLQTGGAAQSGGAAGEPANTGGASTGPLVTLVGTYSMTAEPCTTEPCLPGMVAAIETDTDTIILLVDGHWISNYLHFNGFRPGEALELVGYYVSGGIEVVSMTHIVEWGMAGAGGGNATGGAGGAVPDPGTGGPPMLRMPEGFFIDSTEVTRGQYEAWLATNPSTSGQIEECATNTSFVPECGDASPCQGDDCNRPQVCVDWCDAFQYCQAVGKRLCGSLSQDPAQSEWATACSAHGKNLWVYGNDYDAQVCSVPDLRLDAPTPVASMTSCQSIEPGYEGVYDLIGNVYEWQGSCLESSCDIRGGSYDLIGLDDMQTRCTDSLRRLRTSERTDIGFRCCAS